MKYLLRLSPLFLLAGCGFLSSLTGEDAEQAAGALETLAGLGISVLSPGQAVLGNAITAVVTTAGIMLRRNSTRKKALEEAK